MFSSEVAERLVVTFFFLSSSCILQSKRILQKSFILSLYLSMFISFEIWFILSTNGSLFQFVLSVQHFPTGFPFGKVKRSDILLPLEHSSLAIHNSRISFFPLFDLDLCIAQGNDLNAGGISLTNLLWGILAYLIDRNANLTSSVVQHLCEAPLELTEGTFRRDFFFGSVSLCNLVTNDTNVLFAFAQL